VTSVRSGGRATPRHVLIVEDDRDMSFILERNLTAEGYAVSSAFDGLAGTERALEGVDLIVLDLMLPKQDGFRVLRNLRRGGVETPILLLTARRQEGDKLQGFRLGADDYLTKPFSMPELVARVGALLRRSERARDRNPAAALELLRAGVVEVDLAGHTVRRDGQPVDLTPKAYDLLVALMRRRNRVASRSELLREVWGYAADVTTRTLDTHIADLRRELERDPARPRLIRTVWRVGYRLTDESEGSSGGRESS
jgi:DNA-binding response OmpR family regulator